MSREKADSSNFFFFSFLISCVFEHNAHSALILFGIHLFHLDIYSTLSLLTVSVSQCVKRL